MDNGMIAPENITSEKQSYLKSFWISFIFGLLFGLVSLVIIYFKGQKLNIVYYSVPLYCGLISGLAGIIGTFLDYWLERKGIKKRLVRNIISLIIVMILTLVLTGLIYLRGNFYDLFNVKQNNMVWGVFLGLLFGVFITVIEYYNWKMKQKMLVLELENRYLEELAEKDAILKEATKNLLITRERNRMAQELHDSISQGIHGITFGLSSLKKELNKIDLKESKIPVIVDHLEKTAEATLQELRALINELKPALLEKNNLKKALVTYCELFAARQQIMVDTHIEELSELSPDQELALYRIIQEALANIQKHSEADQVQVILQKKQQKTVLLIRDNGKGFDLEKVVRGNGLNNMEERSRQTGGTLTINTYPGRGTELVLHLG